MSRKNASQILLKSFYFHFHCEKKIVSSLKKNRYKFCSCVSRLCVIYKNIFIQKKFKKPLKLFELITVNLSSYKKNHFMILFKLNISHNGNTLCIRQQFFACLLSSTYDRIIKCNDGWKEMSIILSGEYIYFLLRCFV